MSKSLEGRIAIITGAAAGQGQAVAERFAREGASLALCDIDEEGLAVTRGLVEQAGQKAFVKKVDLRKVTEIKAFVDDVVDDFGGVDIVYNNAGVSVTRSIEDTEEDFWDTIYAINVKSQFFMVKHALPALKQSDHAVVVNVSSMAGSFGINEMAGYCSSKGASNTLTKELAVELDKFGIRVNAILPGLIKTQMVMASLSEYSDEEANRIADGYAARQIMKRGADPSEVASCAAFLVSDESSFVTGELMNVSGGWASI